MAKIDERGLSDMKDRTGEINYNTFGSVMVIKEYRGCMDIDVFFPEYNWTKEKVVYDNFINGKVKCPYEKKVCNIGYLGEGRHKASINGKHTKPYNIWREMLKRCYNPKSIEKRPTYKECEVCPEWHNFQVFADWVDRNYYEVDDEPMDLDKDILRKGNKIYSPDTCIFVPNRINTLFIKRDKCRGDLPIGVSCTNKKYRAYFHTDKLNHLGNYSTPEEAFQVYKQYKEDYIKKVAEEYKSKIPTKLYNAMLNYKVEIDD